MRAFIPGPTPDIWPVLRCAGFQLRHVTSQGGSRPPHPMRMFYARPDHLVVVLEHTIRRPSSELKLTELAVYPEITDLPVATAGPAERARARYFGAPFEPRTPVAVIAAAAIAALSVTVPHRVSRI